jgi:hypothetical protein
MGCQEELNLQRPQCFPIEYSSEGMAEAAKVEQERVGLCLNCQYMKKIQSDRGSTFFLCQRSATDPRFPKYPRLPVIQCTGYEKSRT